PGPRSESRSSACPSSASPTKTAPRSASVKTATVPIPMARAVRKIRRAISPRLATSSLVILLRLMSHPEDAEAIGAGDGVGMGGGEGDPEHRAGVAGVDDPVVEHPAADERRQRLPLDLVLDLP